MSGAAREVQQALVRLARSWPKDPLRPGLDFGEALRRSAEHELGAHAHKPNIAEAHRSLAALERLRSSESLREYPTPHSIIEPASYPNYYRRLVDALARLSHGQSIAPTFMERVRHFFGYRS
mgnify:FL=1